MKELSPCRVETIEKLIVRASEIYGVEVVNIKARTKKPVACIAREVVWFICRKDYSMGLQCLGDYFNGRNHKTVYKGIEAIGREIAVNKQRLMEVMEVGR